MPRRLNGILYRSTVGNQSVCVDNMITLQHSQEAHGQVEKQGGLLKTIGGTKVRMLREDGGIRKLHAC
jgi:hypothetical protein